MQNSDILSSKLDIAHFQRELENELKSNLNAKLILTLSNMLALDYALRASELSKTKEQFISNANKRIKIHLASRYIKVNNFSTAMELFIIAISEDKVYSDSKSQEQLAEYIVDNVLDIPTSNIKNAKSFLKLALSQDKAAILDLVNNSPISLSQIISSGKSHEAQMVDIKKVAKASEREDIGLKERKSLYAMVGSSLVVVGGVAASTMLGGIAAFVVIPATLASFQMGADAGEKLAEHLHNPKDQGKDTAKSVIGRLTKNLEQKLKEALGVNQKNKVQDLQLDKKELVEMKNAISSIKSNLSSKDIEKTYERDVNHKKQNQSRGI